MDGQGAVSNGCDAYDRYLFDLNGYLVIEGAIASRDLAACNETLDAVQHFEGRGRYGHARLYNDADRQEGLTVQQVYEAGSVWEKLIDHPAWIDKVIHFLGTDDPENFDAHHGPAFIDENFASIRGPGQALRLHSGGHVRSIRTQYRYHDGKFRCGQINILMALSDIGPGDGATVVIPGSHKANLRHPQTVDVDRRGEQTSADGVVGAVEVHLKAGDALLFVDCIMHGAARRTNPGQRRMAVYRYGPSWGFFRHRVRPSAELLARLSERQRAIVMPHPEPEPLEGMDLLAGAS